MAGLWAETLRYADLISSILGLAASIVLGWPAWRAITDKQRYEGAAALAKDETDGETRNALEKNVQRLAADQLSGAKAARRVNGLGFALLFLSFLFLMAASVQRAQERAAAAAEAAAKAQAEAQAPA